MKMKDFIPDCDVCGKPMMRVDDMAVEWRPVSKEGHELAFMKSHDKLRFFVCMACPPGVEPPSYAILLPSKES